MPFPHLVLLYLNVQFVRVRVSESYESLVEGVETCLRQIGGRLVNSAPIISVRRSIERTYGRSLQEWTHLIQTRGKGKHSDAVAWLKTSG